MQTRAQQCGKLYILGARKVGSPLPLPERLPLCPTTSDTFETAQARGREPSPTPVAQCPTLGYPHEHVPLCITGGLALGSLLARILGERRAITQTILGDTVRHGEDTKYIPAIRQGFHPDRHLIPPSSITSRLQAPAALSDSVRHCTHVGDPSGGEGEPRALPHREGAGRNTTLPADAKLNKPVQASRSAGRSILRTFRRAP